MGTRYNRLTEAVLTCTHNLCFEEKYKKFSDKKLQFLKLKNSLYIAWACFRNVHNVFGEMIFRQNGF